jgi:hypothetical protein
MGLINDEGRFTYVNIKDGKLVVKRDNELTFFKALEGTLVDIAIKEGTYQNQKYLKLCLMINDVDERFQLQMHLESGYARAFCCAIPNAKPNERMTFSPHMSEKNGKAERSFFLSQGGTALKWAYTRENPNGLPPLEKVKYRGEEKWDNTEQQRFFQNLLLNVIRPQLAAASNVTKDAGTDPKDITEPMDDLPF